MPQLLSPEVEREFRARICRVAERQFASLGYPGVTLRALAEELGCSRMTPYRYFSDKAAILAAVRASGFSRLADACEAAAAAEADPLDRVDALGRAYLRFASEEPDAYRLMYAFPETSDARQYPELTKQLRRSRRPMIHAVQDAIAAGLVVGEPDIVATALWAGLHGIISLRLAGKLPARKRFDAVADAMMSAWLRGFTAEPAADSLPGGRKGGSR